MRINNYNFLHRFCGYKNHNNVIVNCCGSYISERNKNYHFYKSYQHYTNYCIHVAKRKGDLAI